MFPRLTSVGKYDEWNAIGCSVEFGYWYTITLHLVRSCQIRIINGGCLSVWTWFTIHFLFSLSHTNCWSNYFTLRLFTITFFMFDIFVCVHQVYIKIIIFFAIIVILFYWCSNNHFVWMWRIKSCFSFTLLSDVRVDFKLRKEPVHPGSRKYVCKGHVVLKLLNPNQGTNH